MEIRSLLADLQPPSGLQVADSDLRHLFFVCRTGRWVADIYLNLETDRRAAVDAITVGSVRLVVGDLDEVRKSTPALPFSNATVFELNLDCSTASVATSLTGLPPVFMFRTAATTRVSCPFIMETSEHGLRPDLEGIADTLRWGHPLDGRTLFDQISVVRSNTMVSISAAGDAEVSANTWPSLPELALRQVEELIAEQLVAFSQSAARLDTQGAFLSLSGGLDSRAALVAVLSQGHSVPCVTMAGSPKNLDARLAREFCNAYGLRHEIVLLDGHFVDRLTDLLPRAASLSGGIACLGQAVDLFMYESLTGDFSKRISGNLGNQVGRGGVESLSADRPVVEVFSETIRNRLASRSMTPWFIPRLAGNGYGETLFGQEVHFWSIANYVVGSSRALQLTPYADTRLLLLARELFARDSELEFPTRKILRARDLRHRISGTPFRFSFQRRFIAFNDRLAQRIPLNWGWRAAGGSSVKWRSFAVASAADAALIKLGTRGGSFAPVSKWISANLLGHRSALVDWRAMLKGRLRDFTLDTLGSRELARLDIFDPSALNVMLDEHFSDKADHHLTVARALEIALGFSARTPASHHGLQAGQSLEGKQSDSRNTHR